MAGTSSGASNISDPQDVADRSGLIGDQMKALQKKAERLANEKTILSKRVVVQIKKLIDIGEKRASILGDAERKEINVSPEFELWLEKVYVAISEADDLLDDCDYHVHDHLRPQLLIDRKAPKDTGTICGETIDKYLVRPVSTYLVRPVSACVATSMDAIFLRPIKRHLVMPVHSYLVWCKTIGLLKKIRSKLNLLLEEGSTQFSKVSLGAERERSAAMQGVVDVSAAESKIVGKQVDDIVAGLLYSDKDEDLPVNRIVGWAETGKTALARLVYKNEEVMFHFDERMWVQVPDNFDKDKISKSMLTTLTRTPVGEVGKELIQRNLEARLKGKRYLLVLDGVSEVDPSFIQDLKACGGSKGSKILITTGSKPGDESCFFHEMELRSNDYCMALFDEISVGEDDAMLKGKSKNLVKECQGNLLYIKLLGSLMKRMKGPWSDDEASEKLKYGIPQLCFDSMTSLPLKRCFQYCCFFPKGCLMRREELAELWMAQGYLTSTGTDMLELGILYYDILLKSGFLQVSEDDDFDRQSCKVPDLLWDVVVPPGSRDYLNLVGKVKAKDCSEAVHLSLVNRKGKLSRSLREKISKLRTLRLERNDGSRDKLLGDILGCVESLRVLIIVDGSVEELPSSIGKLRRLKYLDISRTKVVRLPESICLLYNLQTLRLYGLEDSPKRIEDLSRSLRHIYLERELRRNNVVPPSLVEFVKYSKSSFKVFMDQNGDIDVWEKMKVPNRCSSISIHGLENVRSGTVEAKTTVLLMKCKVESLKLHWRARRESNFDEDQVLENLKLGDGVKNLTIQNFKGTAFATWMGGIESDRFLQMLVKLDLENCSWCEKLPALGRLRCLKILKIVNMESVHGIGDEFYRGSDISQSPASTVFPALRVFILYRMPNLHDWQPCRSTSEKPFSSLVRLEVEECPKLDSIPDTVVHRHLLKLRIAHCARLTALPAILRGGGGDQKCLAEDLELFGLPSLLDFSIGGAQNLKCLRIGCISTNSTGAAAERGLPDILVEHLSNLTNLTIWGYGLEQLPNWIQCLRSLKLLKLEFSETLESFPSGMQTLKELNISNCPLLEDRCMRGSRPEWKKVCKVPIIVVNGEEIHRPNM